MQSRIDEKFYTEAKLKRLFLELITNFYEDTAYTTAELRNITSDDHAIIWSSLFELEKEARLVRETLMADFQFHAKITKICAADLNKL